MPSPLGRVAERQRGRERFLPLPSRLRRSTFPRGEGFLYRYKKGGPIGSSFKFKRMNLIMGRYRAAKGSNDDHCTYVRIGCRPMPT